MYRKKAGELQVLLVHPGGPFWKNKDLGAWSIPKGELAKDEEPLSAAIREFKEETGIDVDGKFLSLSPIRQKSGKTVLAWAVEGNLDAAAIVSNTFSFEWPPKSGRWQEIPEVDKAGWFTLEEAAEKINVAQAALLVELGAKLQ